MTFSVDNNLFVSDTSSSDSSSSSSSSSGRASRGSFYPILEPVPEDQEASEMDPLIDHKLFKRVLSTQPEQTASSPISSECIVQLEEENDEIAQLRAALAAIVPVQQQVRDGSNSLELENQDLVLSNNSYGATSVFNSNASSRGSVSEGCPSASSEETSSFSADSQIGCLEFNTHCATLDKSLVCRLFFGSLFTRSMFLERQEGDQTIVYSFSALPNPNFEWQSWGNKIEAKLASCPRSLKIKSSLSIQQTHARESELFFTVTVKKD